MKNFLSSILKHTRVEDSMEQQVEEPEPLPEEPEPTEKVQELAQKPPTYVRIPADNLRGLQQTNNEITDTKYKLGQLLAEFEAEKKKLLQQIEDKTKTIQVAANGLRAKYGIPEDSDEYLLNLPNPDQEFGAFIHKGELQRKQQKQAKATQEEALRDGTD
jgi:hypothetical protein